MVKIKVKCEGCGGDSVKERGEVTRSLRIGRRVFCSRSCSATSINRDKKSKEIVRCCPWCQQQFKTTTHSKAAKHCSRSCASKASMSPERREAQRQAGLAQKENLSVAAAMKSREAWKYELLKPLLEGRDFEFECEIGGYIFDLVLRDKKVAIEFDGPDHRGGKQLVLDEKKDKVAKDAGFIVVRREVLSAMVISPETLEGLLS